MNKHYIGDMTRIEYEEAIKQARGVILTIGSTEQHGYHLPLETDSLCGFETMLKVAENTNCLVMPSFNYGQVFSARNFKGTFPISQKLLIKIIKELCVTLENQGAKNIIIYTGHGGNKNSIQLAQRELLVEKGYRNIYLVPYMLSEEVKSQLGGRATKIGHAGISETSLMLYLSEENVRMDLATNELADIPKEAQYRPITWDEYFPYGAFGDCSLATKEKGKLIFDDIVNNLTNVILENIK